MKLTLRPELGGYAAKMLDKAPIGGTSLDRPFVLLAGPNGSGKSAVLRAIRASIGLRGERAGMLDTPMRRHLDPSKIDDPEMLATHVLDRGDATKAADHVPAVFNVSDLGWVGQSSYLFDSRIASSIANKADFDDDMAYHLSLIADGGRNASHGQFVSKTWWEAIEWAVGAHELQDPWNRRDVSPARSAAREAFLGKSPSSSERWLLIDEPETAIDSQTLVVGLSVLLQAAEIGRLRVLCASHSLLFASGLARHPKIQTLDMGPGGTWLHTQAIALDVASDHGKVEDIGKDILGRIRSRT